MTGTAPLGARSPEPVGNAGGTGSVTLVLGGTGIVSSAGGAGSRTGELDDPEMLPVAGGGATLGLGFPTEPVPARDGKATRPDGWK